MGLLKPNCSVGLPNTELRRKRVRLASFVNMVKTFFKAYGRPILTPFGRKANEP